MGCRLMSGMGQSRRFRPIRATSALRSLATRQRTSPEVRLVPATDIGDLNQSQFGALGHSAFSNSLVGLVELTGDLLAIPGMLKQGLGVPLAPARSIEKIASVDMDGAGKAGNRIDDRMDGIAPERLDILLAQRFPSCDLQL